MKKAFSTLESCINNRKEEDECDLYAKIFAKKLRKLPECEREIFMYEIDGMFINRLRHCNNQSLTSCTNPSFTPPVSNQPKSAVEINTPKRPSSPSLSSYSEPELIPHYSISQPHSPVIHIPERSDTCSNSPISNLCNPAQLSISTSNTNISNQLNVTTSNAPNLIDTAFYAALDNYSGDYN